MNILRRLLKKIKINKRYQIYGSFIETEKPTDLNRISYLALKNAELEPGRYKLILRVEKV